jgi:hypothetical protein
VFFREQTPDALIAAIHRLEAMDFPRPGLMAHAAGFGIPEFRRKLRAIVSNDMASHVSRQVSQQAEKQ